MPEPLDVTCSICGTPMLPNLSQADADGCLWICIDPDCPELCAAELETEDLVEGGVPKALAARLVRLIDYYEDTIEELHAQGAGPGVGRRHRPRAAGAARSLNQRGVPRPGVVAWRSPCSGRGLEWPETKALPAP